jgi:hypothetical protein
MKIDCRQLGELEKKVSKPRVYTVKWGTRYGSEYVNKLYRGIKRNTTIDFDFYCCTDDASGLSDEIKP